MVVFAIARAMLVLLVSAAQITIFSYIVHPAKVWIKMSMLGFIYNLGTGMLEIAKKGVFGHHIMKTLTRLHFDLTITAGYPLWYQKIHHPSLLIAFAFVVVCAGIAFASQDRVC